MASDSAPPHLPPTALGIASSRWADVLADVKAADPAVAARWLRAGQRELLDEIERGRHSMERFKDSPAAVEFWIARCAFCSRRLADLRGMLLEAAALEEKRGRDKGGAAALHKARTRGLPL